MTSDRVPSPTLEEIEQALANADRERWGWEPGPTYIRYLLERVRGAEQERDALNDNFDTIHLVSEQYLVRADAAEAQVVALREALSELLAAGESPQEDVPVWAFMAGSRQATAARALLADLPLPAPEEET